MQELKLTVAFCVDVTAAKSPSVSAVAAKPKETIHVCFFTGYEVHLTITEDTAM